MAERRARSGAVDGRLLRGLGLPRPESSGGTLPASEERRRERESGPRLVEFMCLGDGDEIARRRCPRRSRRARSRRAAARPPFSVGAGGLAAAAAAGRTCASVLHGQVEGAARAWQAGARHSLNRLPSCFPSQCSSIIKENRRRYFKETAKNDFFMRISAQSIASLRPAQAIFLHLHSSWNSKRSFGNISSLNRVKLSLDLDL